MQNVPLFRVLRRQRSVPVGLIVLSACCLCTPLMAQVAAPPCGEMVVERASNHFGLEATILSQTVALGDTPRVALTVSNKTSQEMLFPEEVYVMVKGEKDDPETTLRQRQTTHTLRPGERDVLGGGFEPLIQVGGDFTRFYNLSDLYVFRKPGKYSVTFRVTDQQASVESPVAKRTGVCVISNTIPFRITRRP